MGSELPRGVREQLQRLQQLREQLQAIIIRKQQWQLNLSEIERALKELESTSDEAETFKLVGPVMIATPKDKLIDELKERKELAEASITTLDKQEKLLRRQLEDLEKRIRERLTGGTGSGTIGG